MKASWRVEMRSDLRVELPDGTMVAYAEAGNPAGPPVMYLHGSPSSRLEVGLPGIREAAEDLGLRVLAPDRPGMGLSTFCRYSIADYPQLVRSFADAWGSGASPSPGVSGGGKYACACAWVLPDRVTRNGRCQRRAGLRPPVRRPPAPDQH